MRRLVSSLATAVMMATGGLVAVAAPAQAATCTNNFCMYHDTSFRGTAILRTASDTELGSNSDEADSVFNADPVAWVLYDDVNFKDRHYCIDAGARSPNLAAYKFADKVSSVKRLKTANCPAAYNEIG